MDHAAAVPGELSADAPSTRAEVIVGVHQRIRADPSEESQRPPPLRLLCWVWAVVIVTFLVAAIVDGFHGFNVAMIGGSIGQLFMTLHLMNAKGRKKLWLIIAMAVFAAAVIGTTTAVLVVGW